MTLDNYYGWMVHTMNKPNDIFAREAQFYQRQMTQQVYCSFCGKPILLCATDENGKSNDNYQVEYMNRAHMACVQKFYAERMNEQNGQK
jgi:hypothetical protein